MLTNDQVVCIRTVDYSETSQVVTFFTSRTGKVTVLAKGAKRQKSPFGGPIEIFSCGRAVFSDSGRDKMGTLVEFEPLAGPGAPGDSSVLAKNLFAFNCCLFAVELVNLLTTDFDPHPGLFDGLLKFLHDVTDPHCCLATARRGGVLLNLVLFQLRLLREIGLSPVFEICVNCKNSYGMNWPQVYFSNNAKGLICMDCHGAFPDCIRLTKQAAQCFTDAELILSVDDKIAKEMEDVLIRYFTDAIGRPPKMAKYFLGS
jgi:DNA repair protein RecO (recombination protein O)